MYMVFLNQNQERLLQELDYLNHLRNIILNEVSFDREELIKDIDYEIECCLKSLEKEQQFIEKLREDNIKKLDLRKMG